jgi:hypothetical protein
MSQLAKVIGIEALTSISVPVYSAWITNVTERDTPCMLRFPVAVALITLPTAGKVPSGIGAVRVKTASGY